MCDSYSVCGSRSEKLYEKAGQRLLWGFFGKKVKRVKVADKDISHYSYHKILKVDGMVCGNCANHVENALNEIDGVWARVDLGRGEADVYMKTEVEEQELKNRIRNAGYTVYKIETKE